MKPGRRTGPRALLGVAAPGRAAAHGDMALVAVAAVYAGLASGARPFTVPADVAVSVASTAFFIALLAQRLRPDGGPWRRLDPQRPAGRSSIGAALPWLALASLVVGVELASYFHSGPRAGYPTLSYGLDVLFGHRAPRAAGWFCWLAGGWYLVRR